MRLATAAVAAAVMMLGASAVSAQDRPDFSGKWTIDAEKTAAANPQGMGGGGGGGRAGGGGGGGGGGRAGGGMGGGMMGGGQAFELKLDGTTLTRITETQQGAQTVTYKLDGSATQVPMGGRGGQTATATAKAQWQGATLVIETTSQMGQMGNITQKAVYSMEGDYLVITNTTQTPQGEMTRKSYYRKS